MQRRGGFTLIEMILAMVIFSIISLSLYSTFSTGFRLGRKSDGAHKVFRELRLGLTQIQKDIENARPFDSVNLQTAMTRFVGDASTMTILCATPRGLKIVTYRLSPADFSSIQTFDEEVEGVVTISFPEDRRFLIREEFDVKDYINGSTEAQQKEIISTYMLEGGLVWSYAKMQGGSYQWVDSWGEEYLPYMIHVDLNMANPERGAPDLIIQRDFYVPLGGEIEDNEAVPQV